MRTRLHSSRPHDAIRKELSVALAGARRVDAAIAFMTRAGVDLAHREIDTSHCDPRIVTSVRWPTNIAAVAELATRWPNAIWIHLAGASPHEKYGDKYQMHTKALAVEGPASSFRGFVGSHNWTFAALDGLNLEATVEVCCDASDPFAVDLRSHIDACIAESEPFDPLQVEEYQAIQRALHCGPSPSTEGGFEDFENYPAVVIHAEDPQNIALRDGLQLFLGPTDRFAREFIHGRKVDLYLYPPGTLFRPGRPSASPVYFDGEITLVNIKADARVRERQVDSAILDLSRPEVGPVLSFPDIPGAAREVAVRLRNSGKQAPFVYHSNPRRGRPAVRDRVDYVSTLIPGLEPIDPASIRQYLRSPRIEDGHLLREVPASIHREIIVDVPSPDLYPDDPKTILQQRFQRPLRRVARVREDVAERRVFDEEPEQFLIRAAPSEQSRFVFGVTHRSKANRP